MDVLDLYRQAGGYLEGHFLLASGRHSPKFLQSTTVMQYPQHAEAIGDGIAGLFADLLEDPNETPNFVIGPAMGGVTLAFVVARALGCRALFAEKDGAGGMLIREAFEVRSGERFIAVEDVVTTGGSLYKAIAVAEAAGGRCVGIGCIIDRRPEDKRAQVAMRSLSTLQFPTYAPDACPLCDEDVPLEEV